MGDVAGATDSQLYGIADIASTLSTLIFNGQPLLRPFTAPSMIGMIALAGIVVRNCLHIQCSDTG